MSVGRQKGRAERSDAPRPRETRSCAVNEYTLAGAERERILSRRARELARREEPARSAGDFLHLVEFVVAEEHYGFELHYVREVLPVQEVTPLPCTPDFVLGLVNVRGEILSVVNIGRFFDLPEGELTDLNKLIVLGDGGMALGILVDAVLRERSLEPAEIQGSLPTLTGIRQVYLKGVSRDRLVILDAGRMLADRRLVVHEEVEGQKGRKEEIDR